MIKNIIYFSILSLFVVIALIGFNIYHNYKTSTISEETNIHTQSIDPQFDLQTLQELKNRTALNVNLSEKLFLEDNSVSVSSNSAQKQTIPVTPIPSPSGAALQQNLAPVASSSGSGQTQTNL